MNILFILQGPYQPSFQIYIHKKCIAHTNIRKMCIQKKKIFSNRLHNDARVQSTTVGAKTLKFTFKIDFR